MEKTTLEKKYFYGNEISSYGLQNGYVDYRTLAKCFDAVLANDLMEKTLDIGYWEQESGFSADEEEDFPEVFQWYIVDSYGAELLERETNEIIYYNEELDLYLWGVTHFGTAWDYVLTDIKIDW